MSAKQLSQQLKQIYIHRDGRLSIHHDGKNDDANQGWRDEQSSHGLVTTSSTKNKRLRSKRQQKRYFELEHGKSDTVMVVPGLIDNELSRARLSHQKTNSCGDDDDDYTPDHELVQDEDLRISNDHAYPSRRRRYHGGGASKRQTLKSNKLNANRRKPRGTQSDLSSSNTTQNECSTTTDDDREVHATKLSNAHVDDPSFEDDDDYDDFRRDDRQWHLDHARWLAMGSKQNNLLDAWSKFKMNGLDQEDTMASSSMNDSSNSILWMNTEAQLDMMNHQSITDETCPSCKTIMCVNEDGYQVTCHQCHYRSTICDNIVSNVPFNDEIDFNNTAVQSNYTSSHQYATPDILAYALNIRSKILGRMTKSCPYTQNEALIRCIILCIQTSLQKYDTVSITIDDVYACCKAHKWKELYPWITHLFCKITGRALPKLTHLEDEICTAKYRLVRDVYYRVCKPDDRVNFMDYKHVWFKIWEHMGATHLLPFVRLLDAAKLKLQDSIWKDICDHLGWSFIPTEPRKKTLIKPLDQKRLDMCRM